MSEPSEFARCNVGNLKQNASLSISEEVEIKLRSFGCAQDDCLGQDLSAALMMTD